MSHVLPVYNRSDLFFERGEGAYLHTSEGESYLDFAAGIAVNALGHGHPHVVEALKNQAEKLWHVSNMYRIPGLEELADRLAAHSFADKTFFCNSGAEAIECGVKMIRKYHDETGNPQKYRIITFQGAFHGRTLAAISASGSEKLLKGFEPAVDGFDQVPFEDLEAVKEAVGPQTGGILIEPILGEGGIKPVSEEFLRALRELCDAEGLLLMFDEIQCGAGRTGKLYAHEWSGVTPDIMASAKGIGNGFPVGMCLANDKAAKGMKPGSHGSTYGSNPLALAVCNAVLDVMLEDGFLAHVVEMGDYLQQEVATLTEKYPQIVKGVRGKGLMQGMVLEAPNVEILQALRKHRLLTAPASDNVIRLLPPLIITKEHVDEAIGIMTTVCEEYSASS